MPEKVGTEPTRSDAPGADESPFGDMTDDKGAEPVEGEDSTAEAEQDGQASEDAGEQTDDGPAEEQGPTGQTAPDGQRSDDAGEQATPPEDLKVVVSIKSGRATIGVQRPSADPHIETFDDPDLSGLAHEVLAVTERARIRWEDEPKHPAYVRPAPPARRRNRRQQGDAQAANAEGETAQQQTLRLF